MITFVSRKCDVTLYSKGEGTCSCVPMFRGILFYTSVSPIHYEIVFTIIKVEFVSLGINCGSVGYLVDIRGFYANLYIRPLWIIHNVSVDSFTL